MAVQHQGRRHCLLIDDHGHSSSASSIYNKIATGQRIRDSPGVRQRMTRVTQFTTKLDLDDLGLIRSEKSRLLRTSNAVSDIHVKADKELSEAEFWELVKYINLHNDHCAGTDQALSTIRSNSDIFDDIFLPTPNTRTLSVRAASIPPSSSSILSVQSGGITEIDLSNWDEISQNHIRTLSLFLGPMLKTVNFAGCTNMTDQMTNTLCVNASELERLDLHNCVKLTDASIRYLVRNCGKTIQYLDVSGCSLLTNDACRWIGGATGAPIAGQVVCSKLQVLIMNDCPRISNLGVESIGKKRCPNLCSLGVASNARITNGGLLQSLGTHKNLCNLNVEGCIRLTRKSLQKLMALINTRRRAAVATTATAMLVREAVAFFGFVEDVAVKAVKEEKLFMSRQKKIREQDAARKLAEHRKRLKEARKRRLFEERHEEQQEAANILQQVAKRWRRETLYNEMVCKAAIVVRSMFVWQAKKHIALIKMHQAQHESSILVNAMLRRARTRTHDNVIQPALDRFRKAREKERQRRGANLVQGLYRSFSARQTLKSAFETAYKQRQSQQYSSMVMQKLVRNAAARRMIAHKKEQKRLRDIVERDAAITLQKLTRRNNATKILLRKQAESFRQRGCASMIQSSIRATARRQLQRQGATTIQRHFRGTRILHWKYIKLNQIAAHALMRQSIQVEEAKRRIAVRLAKEHKAAVKRRKAKLALLSQNNRRPKTDDTSLWALDTVHELPDNRDMFERQIVGLKCTIFWPKNQQWFGGTIKRFNKQKWKWRVEYDDADFEWIDLQRNHARVKLWLNDEWKDFPLTRDHKANLGHTAPELMTRKKHRRNIERYVSNELLADLRQWSYVAEGLLQELSRIQKRSSGAGAGGGETAADATNEEALDAWMNRAADFDVLSLFGYAIQEARKVCPKECIELIQFTRAMHNIQQAVQKCGCGEHDDQHHMTATQQDNILNNLTTARHTVHFEAKSVKVKRRNPVRPQDEKGDDGLKDLSSPLRDARKQRATTYADLKRVRGLPRRRVIGV
jgi:hypothetical protein